MKERIKWIDVAKGICIISVIAGHLGVKEINAVVYAFHLTVFFILSGYTMKNTDINKEVLNKKFISLMIPYFITCFCVMLMDIINSIVVYKNTSNEVITHIVSKNLVRTFFASGSITKFGNISVESRIGAIWFLPALFFAGIFARIILNYVREKKIQYILASALAFTGMISARFVWLPFSIQPAMYSTFFVLSGYHLRENKYIDNLKFKNIIIPFLFFAGMVTVDKARINFVSADSSDFLLSGISGICASLVIIYISKKVDFVKPLQWAGRYSLYILCIHLFEMETLYPWFDKVFKLLHIKMWELPLFIFKLAFIFAVTAIIVYAKKIKENKQKNKTEESTNISDLKKRDEALDYGKGILIILMLTGHFSIDKGLRDIIYSFHMMAFVVFSGYYFNPKAAENIGKAVWKLIKAFVFPYVIFSIIYVVINSGDIVHCGINALLGLSFTKRFFNNYDSIGPVYFVLMLFMIRLIYLILCKVISSEKMQHIAVLLISLAGVFLGAKGVWLPWSFDCAMYAIIFYHLGYCLRKYGIMNYISQRLYWYFILVTIWAFMIYSGGMELAVRDYGSYGVTVLGALAATILMYAVSKYLVEHTGKLAASIMSYIGKSTLYILMLHTLFRKYIFKIVDGYFTRGYIFNMIIMILIQLILGVIITFVMEKVSTKSKKIT